MTPEAHMNTYYAIEKRSTGEDGSNNLHVLTAAISTMMKNNESSANTSQGTDHVSDNPHTMDVNNGIHVQSSNTLGASPLVGDEVVIEEHNRLPDSMVEMRSKTISMTIPERKILDDFITARRNLDHALDGTAQTHGILTLLDPPIVHGRQAVAPFHSKELLLAID